MARPILVTGASGRTGSAIGAALMARGVMVRGLVRGEEKAARIAAAGVEPALGDLNEPDSLRRAAAGCEAVIHIGPPMDPREVQQTRSMLDAAERGGAERFIYYSVLQPLRQDVDHHRRKLEAEAHVVESDLPHVIVQPARYMQHLEPIWATVGAEGVHEMPFGIEVKFNVADLADLAEATAIVATQPGHLYASYELAGPEALSQRDMATILSSCLGRPVVARQLDLDEMARRAAAKGMPPERIACMMTMNRHYDRHGFRGNANVLRWIIGREPRRFAEYVAGLLAAG